MFVSLRAKRGNPVPVHHLGFPIKEKEEGTGLLRHPDAIGTSRNDIKRSVLPKSENTPLIEHLPGL
jgi:hypothetical protein